MKVQESAEVRGFQQQILRRRQAAQEQAVFFCIVPLRVSAWVRFDTLTSAPRWGDRRGRPHFRLTEQEMGGLRDRYVAYLRDHPQLRRRRVWFNAGPEIGAFKVLRADAQAFADQVRSVLLTHPGAEARGNAAAAASFGGGG